MMTAEKIVYDHLVKSMSVPVSFERFSKDPERFIIIERVGGSITGHIEKASFAIQSYAESMFEACELNGLVREAMTDLIQSDLVSSVDLDSDYNWTDEETKKFRYQGIYDLVLFI
ncbi:hypothetical protein [Ileibacterium valens]|nr:hypothetical protein [Ileibacterium valens]